MLDTMTRYLEGMADNRDAFHLLRILSPLVDRYSSQPLNSAGLVITGAASPTAKTGAADFYASVTGVLVKITASTNMPALTGINTTTNGNFTVACFFVDSAGAVTALGGTEAATLGGVKFPQFPAKKALIGFLIITSATTFTGGTTALDAATTVYVSPLGPFDPTVLI